MALALTAVLGDQPQVWPLQEPRVRIGRARSNTVQIHAASVSREHAEIAVKGGRLVLRDLRSRNGTWVNGVRIHRPVEVRAGDSIHVGRVSLRLSEAPTNHSARAGTDPDSSETLEIPVAEVLAGRPGSGACPEGLIRLLEKAGRLLVQQRSLRHTCEEFLQAVEMALPRSRLTLLLLDSPSGELTLAAARAHGVSVAESRGLPEAVLRAVLDRHTAVSLAGAAIAAPLQHEGRPLGLLYAEKEDQRTRYTRENMEVLTLFANMAAMCITNQKLLDAERELSRIEHELHLAGRIQRWLLPAAEPSVEGYELHARLEPCEHVGGDFYDVQTMPDGTAWLLLGDVSGKGVSAAILMSLCLSSARLLYDDCGAPGAFASRLNRLLVRWTGSESFATAFIGRLTPETGALHYVNAGHAAPLLLAGRSVRRLDSTGMALGVRPEFEYAESRLDLTPGATLALFSDGMPEARRGRQFFGDRRVMRTLKTAARCPCLEEAGQGILRDVDAFLAGQPRCDDIALLMIRRARASGRRGP